MDKYPGIHLYVYEWEWICKKYVCMRVHVNVQACAECVWVNLVWSGLCVGMQSWVAYDRSMYICRQTQMHWGSICPHLSSMVYSSSFCLSLIYPRPCSAEAVVSLSHVSFDRRDSLAILACHALGLQFYQGSKWKISTREGTGSGLLRSWQSGCGDWGE